MARQRTDNTLMTMRITTLMLPALVMLGGCAGMQHRQSDQIAATYHCQNGQTVQAQYAPPDEARVTIGDRTLDMHIAVSADGARYVGGDRVWWTKGSGEGSTGTLFAHDPDTQITGRKITLCTQVDPTSTPDS